MYPKLAEEWDYENNTGRARPETISWTSSTRFSWVCKCGNHYKASPNKRVEWLIAGIHACPICRRKWPVIIPKENSIGVNYPELKELWDYEKNKGKGHPDRIICNSSATYYWLCKNGHSYKATPGDMITHLQNQIELCPHCRRETTGDTRSVANTYPELAKEWDYEKNIGKKGPALPERISIDSSGYYYWKCSKGHSYTMSPVRRIDLFVRGATACPKCKRFIGYAYPEISSEWDYAGNDPSLNPYNILCTSPTALYWKCKQGHSYKQSPRLSIQLLKKGAAICPICRGATNNLLIEAYPDIAAEWDYTKNLNRDAIFSLSCSNTSPYYWKCKEGHSYKQSASKIVRFFERGIVACPVCSGRKTESGQSLLDLHPDIAEEWDYIKNKGKAKPSRLSCRSSSRYDWICKRGHHYRASPVDLIKLKDNGQILCTSCREKHDEKSFAMNYPDILSEWDFEKNKNICSPYNIPYSSESHVNFICKNNHSYFSSPFQRVKDKMSGRISCPYCDDRKAWPGFNSFAVRYPDLVEEWDFENNDSSVDPDCITVKYSKYVQWKCLQGHSYSMPPSMRIYYKESKEIACPYCGDRSVLPGYNSFASKHKDLLQEWDYVNNYALVDPDQIGDSDRTQVWMICRDDPTHKYETSVADRLMFQERGRNPCPYCKGRMRKRKHFVQK